LRNAMSEIAADALATTSSAANIYELLWMNRNS
jgi:hypothetical protein